MTAKHILVIALAGVSIFTGCKKDDEAPAPVNGNIKQVQTKIINNAGGVVVFYSYNTFDSENRLVETLGMDGLGNVTGKQVYVYDATTVSTVGYDPDLTTISYADTYQLNDNGQAINSMANPFAACLYDADGHLLRYCNPSDTTVYSYYNGNKVNEYRTASGNVTQFTAYNYSNLPDYRNTGTRFLGAPSKNLVTTEVSQAGYTSQYLYEFDTKGRVTKQTVARYGSTYITSYKYFD